MLLFLLNDSIEGSSSKECLRNIEIHAIYFNLNLLTENEKKAWEKLKENIKKGLKEIKCFRCPKCKRKARKENIPSGINQRI